MGRLTEQRERIARDPYTCTEELHRELVEELDTVRAELEQVTAERDDLLRACRVAAFWNVHGMEAVHIHAMQMLLRLAVERNSEKKEG